MSRGTRILSLVGGIVVFVTGVLRIVQKNEWTLAIIGALILAFTMAGFFKDNQK